MKWTSSLGVSILVPFLGDHEKKACAEGGGICKPIALSSLQANQKTCMSKIDQACVCRCVVLEFSLRGNSLRSSSRHLGLHDGMDLRAVLLEGKYVLPLKQ